MPPSFTPENARRLDVQLLPQLMTPERLRGAVVVLIDVLRATTTMVHALAAGAACVIPCEHVDEARTTAARFPRAQVLLGGERGGAKIGGFDLGNSPAEYTAERCRGKIIVFTTTNGTQALARSQQADQILIGAFVNLQSLCNVLAGDARPLHLLCAGTQGEITLEDTLLSGAIIDALQQRGIPLEFNDPAKLALFAYHACRGRIREEMEHSRGAQDLKRLQLEKDIDDAAQVNRFDLVPKLEKHSWRIVV